MDTEAPIQRPAACDASGTVLAQLENHLDRFADLERLEVSAEDRVQLAHQAVLMAQRTYAVAAVLASEAETAEAGLEAQGAPLTSLLALDPRIAAREVAGYVFAGKEILAHEPLRERVLTGQISVSQARAITHVLNNLPNGMTAEQTSLVLDALIQRAPQNSAHKLRRSRDDVLAEAVPDIFKALDKEAEAENRRDRAAHRRTLAFYSNGDGTTTIKGRLPNIEAAAFLKHIKAQVESDRRRGRDLPNGDDTRTHGQRMADGLIAWVRRGTRGARLAGDRPRVVILMDYHKLKEMLEQNGILDTGEEISPSELRRACCDADLMSVVLGGDSEVLDVGMTQRLVPPAIRRALSLRDQGCVFPGCALSDERCEAHHIVPWWAGGRTALDNLTLLCPHHHALIEPPRFWAEPQPDRWEVRIGPDSCPEVIPPARHNPVRTSMRHERFG